jgi:hypothetical protein
VREDRILPHLAAVAVLLAGDGRPKDVGTLQVTGPAETTTLIDQLRVSGVILTYDPDTQTLRTDGAAVTASQNR